jgi:hypothetical protein
LEIQIKGLEIVRELIYSMRRIYQHPSTPPEVKDFIVFELKRIMKNELETREFLNSTDE